MSEKTKYLIGGLIVALALAAAAWAFWPTPAAAAPKKPDCVPAFTTGKFKDDLGAQITAGFLFIPMGVLTAASYATDQATGITKPLFPNADGKLGEVSAGTAKAACGTAAVGLHALRGVKQVIEVPAKATGAVGGAVYNFVQPTP